MKWCYQTEYVACGKKCTACPHGPYWYRYRRELGRLVKKYVGKFEPFKNHLDNVQRLKPDDHRKAIFDGAKATPALAYAILGLKPGCSEEEAKNVHNTLSSFCRTDLDNLHEELALLNCAYTYLRVYNDWR